MIFAPSIARAVLRGEVTQTRRPVQARDPYYRQSRRLKSTGRSRILVQPYKPREGDRFPVQQRVRVDGKPTVETQGHAVISSVEIVHAGDLNLQDARQMGYRTTSEAMAAWLIEYDPAWVCEDQPCQACGGPGLTGDGFCVTCGCDDQAAARFTRRHASREVWVIRFAVDTSHVPRLLAALPAEEGDHDGDYVTSPSRAMAQEAEALSAADFKIHVECNAEMTHAQWLAVEHATREAELEQLSLGRRLDKAIAEARNNGMSVTREVRVIEKRLKALENQAAPRRAA